MGVMCPRIHPLVNLAGRAARGGSTASDSRATRTAWRVRSRSPPLAAPGSPLSVLDAQDLGQVGEERVGAESLPVVRIEAAEGPGDVRPRADHASIDINRQPCERQALDGLTSPGHD